MPLIIAKIIFPDIICINLRGKMKHYFLALSFLLFISLLSLNISAQSDPQTSPPPKPMSSDNSSLTNNLQNQSQDRKVSREKRAEAYQKLLEGHRYLLNVRDLNDNLKISAARLAKNALQKAVELEPNLAEAYTTMAELALITPPQGNLEEALLLARIATKLDKNNFGGHRILARLNTIKSNLGRGNLNSEAADVSIYEWKEIARLDPRNAEAWAFLSEFYEAQNEQELQINALKNWVSSATPLDVGFFGRVMEREKIQLTVEDATLKLGAVLLKSGDSQEALEFLSRSIADDPGNLLAIELFKQSLEGADKNSLLSAIDALRQAVFVNSKNESLVQLLAQTLAKTGQIDDAAKVLRGAVAENIPGDKNSASNFQVVLGDIFVESERTNEAIAAYQNALKIRGIENTNLAKNENKDFAIRVVGKMIQAYKKANRPNDAKILIEKYRALFGKNDLFADKDLITLFQNIGKNVKLHG